MTANIYKASKKVVNTVICIIPKMKLGGTGKGQLMGLADNVVALGVIAIVIAFVALILAQTETQVISIAGANSVADNATKKGISAMGTFGDWLPIIAIVVVAGMILYLLFRYLMGGTKSQ